MRVLKRSMSVGVVAGSAVVAGLLMVVPASASTSYPTSLTEVAPAAITYGQAAIVSGRLTLSGAPFGLAEEKVALYQRTKGTATWALVATHTTNGQGDASFTVAPKHGEQYELRHAADTYTAASSSPVRTVNIRFAVTASLAKSSVVRRATDTISTTVAPNAHAATVRLQELVSGSWQTVASLALNTSSAATFRFTAPAAAGKYDYRVLKAGTQAYLAGVSPTKVLTVS